MQRVQAVDTRQRCRGNGHDMTERPLSAVDAAVCERVTQLSVYIPFGFVRGPVQDRWQSCPDEDSPERWKGCDVSRARELCMLVRGIAGGHLAMCMAGLRRLPRSTTHWREPGVPPIGTRTAQFYERSRRPRRRSARSS